MSNFACHTAADDRRAACPMCADWKAAYDRQTADLTSLQDDYTTLREANDAEIARLKADAIHTATPFTAAACLKLEEIIEQKDKEIAALQASTLRVVEALETVNPWCMVSHKHVVCDIAKVQDALADPVLAKLRRDTKQQDEDEEDQGHENICRSLRRVR